MADDPKEINLKEFRDFGYLQEVNRRFFHPLGLALIMDCEGEDENLARLAIQDFRHLNEGHRFPESLISIQKAERLQAELDMREYYRIQALGWFQQPACLPGCLQVEDD